MRVLVSAYACEPDVGSESEVGWQVVRRLAITHSVVVVTRENHADRLREALSPALDVRVVGIDLPPRLRRIVKKGPRGARIYYRLWQRALRRTVAQLHEEDAFDVLHHLTWASISVGTPLRTIPAPLVLGPVGGGVPPAWRLLPYMPVRYQAYEALRAVSIGVRNVNLGARATWRQAQAILCQNHETRRRLPRSCRARASVLSNVGVESGLVRAHAPSRPDGSGPRAVFLGRLLPHKGAAWAIRAIAADPATNATLTIVGDGPHRGSCERLAERLGVADRVEFLGWLPRNEALAALDDADVLLLPTQHDEGGPLAVAEAMARGLRVVALDRGGPAVSVGGAGVVVKAAPARDLAQRLARGLTAAAELPPEAALGRARELTWDSLTAQLDTIYRELGARQAGAR